MKLFFCGRFYYYIIVYLLIIIIICILFKSNIVIDTSNILVTKTSADVVINGTVWCSYAIVTSWCFEIFTGYKKTWNGNTLLYYSREKHWRRISVKHARLGINGVLWCSHVFNGVLRNHSGSSFCYTLGLLWHSLSHPPLSCFLSVQPCIFSLVFFSSSCWISPFPASFFPHQWRRVNAVQ